MEQPYQNGKLQQLKATHNEQQNRNVSNDDNTIELVQILGGIDQILSDYLKKENNSKLNENQIDKLYEVITTQESQDEKVEDIAIGYGHDERKTYYFHRNETYLSLLFGVDRSKKIMNILSSNLLTIIGILIFIPFSILVYVLNKSVPHIYSGGLCIFYIPIVILTALSMNRVAFTYVIRGFEFWFKFVYVVQFIVSYHIYSYLHTENQQFEMDDTGDIIISALWAFITCMLLLLTCSIDALQFRTFTKAILNGFWAAIYAYVSFYFYMMNYMDSDAQFNVTKDVSFSLTELIAGSSQVLSIFFAKTCIFALFRRNKCILIKYSPFIQWIPDKRNNESESNNDNQP